MSTDNNWKRFKLVYSGRQTDFCFIEIDVVGKQLIHILEET